MSEAKKPKPIIISSDGNLSATMRRALEQRVKSVHPYGGKHTFTSDQICMLSAEGERRFGLMGHKRTERIGAQMLAVSGVQVAKAYRHGRLATQVKLIRVARGWEVVCITATKVDHWGGEVTLLLTPAQIKIAVEKLLMRIGAERL